MHEQNLGLHEYDSEQCSAIISHLPGIYTARMRFEEGNLVEIHVLGSTERNPKQIARDIQSAIYASYGIEIDHRIISIAQLPANPFASAAACAAAPAAEEELPFKEFRPLFAGIDAFQKNGQFDVSVHLSWNGVNYTGKGHCRDTLPQRNRVIAKATLDAVNEILGMEYFSLIEVKQLPIWDVNVAVTVIEHMGLTSDDSSILIGDAAQRDNNPASGIVRSALDGINRCISKLHPIPEHS